MASEFDGRITAIEREIEAQKAVRFRSSSEMVTTTKSATVRPTVVGSKVVPGPGQPAINTVVPKKLGCAEITLENTGFVSVAVKSGYSGRKFYQNIYAESGSKWIYKFQVYQGTQADIDYCHGSSSVELAIPFELEITGTSEFDVRVYQD
jgi:hypothetical protein